MDMSALGNLSSGQKDELMDQVRQQIAVANAQELLTVHNLKKLKFPKKNYIDFPCFFQKMTEKCFKKCVIKPGSVLDGSEQVSNLAAKLPYRFLHKIAFVIFVSSTEMHSHVYGSIYGLVELGVTNVWSANPTRTTGWHVKGTLSTR